MGEADPLQRIETDRLYTRPHTVGHYWCGHGVGHLIQFSSVVRIPFLFRKLRLFLQGYTI